MLEVKKGLKIRGNVASVIANLEKRQKKQFQDSAARTQSSEVRDKPNRTASHVTDDKENSARGKESESESEKEQSYRVEEPNQALNTINEESAKPRGAEDSNSSPEESTLKHTWSGSGSPAVLSSGSDVTSSGEEEEEQDGGKRNSMTKDCNDDFRWVVSDKTIESKALFDTVQEVKSRSNFYDDFGIEERKKKPESNPFFSMDRNRKIQQLASLDAPVQLRLPPHGFGSLDRKRIPKTRSERDQKCKSSVITRPTQSCRKSPAKVLPEELTLQRYETSRKLDCYHQREQRDHRDSCQSCQHCPAEEYRRHSHHCHGHHRHHQHQCHQSCNSFNSCSSCFGSCESIHDRNSSFGSQKNLLKLCEVYDDRRSPRKNSWQGSQPRLVHASNECLCQLDREKSQSWRILGKSGPELEDRLIRLENDKESLQLQVSVLTEQVEAQSEKISDLQHSLEDKKLQLNSAEDLLQREMLTRSSLETQKLELMSAISELKLQQAAVERENYELKEEKKRFQAVKPPMMPRNTSPALLQTTPLGANRYSPNDYGARKSGNPFSSQELYDSSHSNPFAESHQSHQRYMSSSTPNSNVGSMMASPSQSPVVTAGQRRDFSPTPQSNLRRGVDQYNSLPRQKLLESEHLSHLVDVHRKNVAFAETERLSIRSEHPASRADDIDNSVPVEMTHSHNSKKGIRKIFDKIKRSNSGNVNDFLGDGEFRRGGVRATAGPRLGGPIVQIHIVPDKPFAEWDTENLCNWMEDLGLENYVADLRRWIKNGSQLLAASSHDLEKELGMKNPLHKKKLLLALQEMNDKGLGSDELLRPAGCLDTQWVLRWLDDVGLPQHKEVFLTARIDGRMLHRLTMDDLATLHITSMLHVASLKKGIKVLREHKMEPNCLTRRSVPEEPSPTAADVALWTNHRVMEWLRVVDLAEYAPNLRGSGVHGALMVYETKFTAELLASLLSIPPNKTLLRRHLNTHFKLLLGRDVIQGKREAETTLGYIPLTPSAKVKTVKKPQFTLKRKKSKNELDYGDLVCPLDEGTSGEHSTPSNTCVGVTGDGMMKEKRHVPDVCPVTDPSARDSPVVDRLSRV